MPRIELDIECKSCGGTGVYRGMTERKGAAVVCTTCNGTGKQTHTFEYTEFTGRKLAHGVERVYLTGMGYQLVPYKITYDDVGEIDMSKEGVSYAEFMAGVMPGHVERLGCPMNASQSDCNKIIGFKHQCTYDVLRNCEHYGNKAECWKRFHAGSKP